MRCMYLFINEQIKFNLVKIRFFYFLFFMNYEKKKVLKKENLFKSMLKIIYIFLLLNVTNIKENYIKKIYTKF